MPIASANFQILKLMFGIISVQHVSCLDTKALQAVPEKQFGG